MWLKLARSAVPGTQPLSGPKPRLPQGERELTSIKCLPHVGVSQAHCLTGTILFHAHDERGRGTSISCCLQGVPARLGSSGPQTAWGPCTCSSLCPDALAPLPCMVGSPSPASPPRPLVNFLHGAHLGWKLFCLFTCFLMSSRLERQLHEDPGSVCLTRHMKDSHVCLWREY